MGFRTLEISNPAEIHVKRSQLEITEQGVTVMIPLEDLTTVICSGANIRMSTMAQSQMASAGISLMVINEKYHPSCIIMPIESNVRQTLVLHHACLIQIQKISVQAGIDEMVACLRNIVISQRSSELKQPLLLPIEIIEAIKE